MFSLLQKINDGRSSLRRSCDAGEPSAEVLKASPAGRGQPQNGFLGKKKNKPRLPKNLFLVISI